MFSLPPLPLDVEQEVGVEFAKSRGGSAKVTCTWLSGPEWSCDPAPRAVEAKGFRYHFDDAYVWFVRITGPAGTLENRETATNDDPGEGTFPTSCPLCYDAELGVKSNDLERAGVDIDGPPPPAPPTFGETCSINSNCDPSLFCGPTAARPRTCTASCAIDGDCFAGTICSDGYCARAP